MTTVGLALITKNEVGNLPGLLQSIEGAFDQVALLDTGSTDKTATVFRQWAKQEKTRNAAFRFSVEDFRWVDDFAAARSAADQLLNTDWNCWADADDEILGAENLRTMAEQAPASLAAFVFGYDYARDPNGNCACFLRRERLVRAGAGRWVGRVHESQLIDGQSQDVPGDTVLWRHRKAEVGDSSERNQRILEKWLEDEPENPRVLSYLGTEHLVVGDHEEAIPFFERYIVLRTGWDEERAQVHRKLASCLIALGRFDEAVEVSLNAVRLLPSWPDSYLSLAEIYHQMGEFAKAVYWADEVLRIGQPQSLLIINPLDYSLTPLLIKSSALGGLRRWDDAITVAEQALGIDPGRREVVESLRDWNGFSSREATAKTWCAAAVQLVGADEQLKALELIEETVPAFARDHPDVVRLRSQLRERVRPLIGDEYVGVYAAGVVKPESVIPDEKVDEWAGQTARARFLLAGISEQLEGVV